jgi:hypothetical protein
MTFFGIPPLAVLRWPVPKERSGLERLLSILHKRGIQHSFTDIKPANQLNHLLTTLSMTYKCWMHSLQYVSSSSTFRIEIIQKHRGSLEEFFTEASTNKSVESWGFNLFQDGAVDIKSIRSYRRWKTETEHN